jgi:hypothetical protein
MTTENDSRHLPAVPADGKCKCGCASFTLAEDKTTYSPGIFFKDGRAYWGGWSSDTQLSDAEDSVRFMCAACGERYAVPQELVE